MQKSIWKVLVLFLTLAALGQQVSAKPIVSQVLRFTQADAIWDVGIRDSQGTNLLGPADLSASVSASRPTGDAGTDTLHAQSSQHSTVDAFGFSYTASLEVDGFNHGGPAGNAQAISFLNVTYDLDVPYAYQFTRGALGVNLFDILPFSPF